jgi:hypothetical protein
MVRDNLDGKNEVGRPPSTIVTWRLVRQEIGPATKQLPTSLQPFATRASPKHIIIGM